MIETYWGYGCEEVEIFSGHLILFSTIGIHCKRQIRDFLQSPLVSTGIKIWVEYRFHLSLQGDQCSDSHMKFPPPSALSTYFLPLMGEPKTGFSSLHVPLCLAGKRYRIQSCEKPPARLNWRLTRLLTRVARETVAKGAWAAAQPDSPHVHRHKYTCTRIFLYSLHQLTMTEVETLGGKVKEDLGQYWKHQMAYCQN